MEKIGVYEVSMSAKTYAILEVAVKNFIQDYQGTFCNEQELKEAFDSIINKKFLRLEDKV